MPQGSHQEEAQNEDCAARYCLCSVTMTVRGRLQAWSVEHGAWNERVGNGTGEWHEPLNVSWKPKHGTPSFDIWMDSQPLLFASTSSLECGSLRRATSRALDVPLGMSCRAQVLSCPVLSWPDELNALKQKPVVDSENECLAETGTNRWRERLRESRGRSDTFPGLDVPVRVESRRCCRSCWSGEGRIRRSHRFVVVSMGAQRAALANTPEEKNVRDASESRLPGSKQSKQ